MKHLYCPDELHAQMRKLAGLEQKTIQEVLVSVAKPALEARLAAASRKLAAECGGGEQPDAAPGEATDNE